MNQSRHFGFTLIELSIVLVIIGLVVGGVLVGQDLIAAATIRAQVSQLSKYSTAVNTFMLKYDALPGDIPQSKAWASGLPATGNNQDPNGNGAFDTVGREGGSVVTNTAEFWNFWPQLATAGLVEGSYTCPTWDSCQGLQNAAWTGLVLPSPQLGYFPAMKLNSQLVVLPTSLPHLGGNFWVLGIPVYGNLYDDQSPSLSPSQALQLDQKMDDGVPNSGGVIADKNVLVAPNGVYYTEYMVDPDDNSGGAGCVSAGGACYNVINSSTACKLLVKMQ